MRIDKYLCEMNLGTRKDVKDIIKGKHIKVNDVLVTDSSFKIDEAKDVVTYKGNVLYYEKYVYYMLNKPSGVVSATKDNISKTVIDIIEDKRDGLSPVGRLDKDTEGLLIITDDGELNHHLTSPKHHINKTYLVHLRDNINEFQINALETGIELKDDSVTKPAIVKVLSEKEIYLTIYEGKFHQVKRMLIAVGNEVTYLKRISMGDLKLDHSLNPGEYRKLTKEEIECLKI